jgi:hypothetical protein
VKNLNGFGGGFASEGFADILPLTNVRESCVMVRTFSCEVSNGKSGFRTGLFFLVLRFSPVSINSGMFRTCSFIYVAI